jgi:hypothetical protein
MTRGERAQRVSHASGAGSEAGARERPPTLFELRRGLAVALAKAEVCWGDRGGEAPRFKR